MVIFNLCRGVYNYFIEFIDEGIEFNLVEVMVKWGIFGVLVMVECILDEVFFILICLFYCNFN